MRSRLNRGQRTVLVVALGAALLVVSTIALRWVEYGTVAPSGNFVFGNEGAPLVPRTILHPWVEAVYWLAAIGVWASLSVAILGGESGRPPSREE